ncbi:hypothetical protein PGB90_008325 [Kerria lacca]
MRVIRESSASVSTTRVVVFNSRDSNCLHLCDHVIKKMSSSDAEDALTDILLEVIKVQLQDLQNKEQKKKIVSVRYILYDVNPQEGFNLRRDVYIRLAVFLRILTENSEKWKLVLPPWNELPHWTSSNAGIQRNLPWSLFFNLRSLQNYAPVIEMFEFNEDHCNVALDYVVILQHYKDVWEENFTWVDKWDVEECQQPVNFKKVGNGMYVGSLFGYNNITAKKVVCVSFQGTALLLKNILDFLQGRFIAFEHAEIVLHDHYGGPEYWKCRKSMKFSNDLFKIATDFRKSTLPSENNENHVNFTYFLGYSYLAVHLRRRDYLLSHPLQVPNITHASDQIKIKLRMYNLNTTFIATDAFDEEIEQLIVKVLPFKVVRYIPSLNILQKYKDGGVAIIEQIVCSYARYFIGSYESTFSFRIQEERELLNFHPDTTFNRFCGNAEINCKQPSRWLKVE